MGGPARYFDTFNWLAERCVKVARARPGRATVYARLDAAVVELRTRLGGLPSPKESESIWSDIWHRQAHHSTALEGNTLVLRGDAGRWVGGVNPP